MGQKKMMANDRNSKEARTCFILGMVLSKMNYPECAVELFRGTLRWNPTLVAAHVHLGHLYAKQESYEEMLAAFREAVHLDLPSVRAAVVEWPEEVSLIERLLDPPEPMPATGVWVLPMPAEYVEAGNLVSAGMGYIAEGRDEEAVRALEHSLRIDPEFSLAISLLSLAYLLLREYPMTMVAGNESMLRAIDPALAKLIFSS